ncbi:transcriptional regulator [Neisseria chenwenguii]|uniref:Transcriptional regulator n=1 Tax=Neisseria chenwenguii TaxID=1853278 RepID=A0A220S3P4_9NEIS|nr:protein YgfX [Neisseria chenwenguii]ASK28121.1 transcriptional regulator [Neisseria chenwenguii]
MNHRFILKPSGRLKILAAALHLAALSVCITAFYGWMMWAGLAAVLLSFAYAWQTADLRRKDAVIRIDIDLNNRASLLFRNAAEDQAAALCGASAVSRHALFLQWDTGSRKVWQAVFPDMLGRDDYRRLQVWARWHQTKENNRPSETGSKIT